METLILDTPSAKKRRVMDMPIYLLFRELDSRRTGKFRWYVIESRCGSEDTAAAGELLGEEHYLKKSEEDGVRDLPLPDIQFYIHDSLCFLVVSKSRLFIMDLNDEIAYFDLNKQRSDQEWKRCDSFVRSPTFVIQTGAAVSDDGDWIYAMQNNKVIRFRCDNPQDWNPDVLSDLDDWPRFLFALSGSKMLMYGPAPGYNHVRAAFYDLENHSWTMIDSFPVGSVDWRDLPSRAVLVSDSFLILYSAFHPEFPPKFLTDSGSHFPLPMITITEEYCPGLYVYDIRRKKWLSEPVQGITDFPYLFKSIHDGSVLQVRRDVLKLAFVWAAMADEELFYFSPEDNIFRQETEVHWSKFILRIEDNETLDIPPTFHAEGLSSGIILGGDTRLMTCTAGN